MKKLILAGIFFLIQNGFSEAGISLVGPRAGVGLVLDNTGTGLDKGAHSAFGWQVEVPYKSDKLTGYAEAGLLLLGAEQGIFYPDVWGFFGVRYEGFGFGAGPVANPMGIGIGFGPYYQFTTGTLRIPVGVNVEVIDKRPRFQALFGFNIK